VPNAILQSPSDQRDRPNTLYKTRSGIIDLTGSYSK
jgi:hypothetical protein